MFKFMMLLLLVAIVAFQFITVGSESSAVTEDVTYEVVTLNEVLQDPGRYLRETVKINGTVSESNFGIAGVGIYELRDKDGHSIYVVTERGIPESGTDRTVRGIVDQLFAFKGYNVLSIHEH